MAWVIEFPEAEFLHSIPAIVNFVQQRTDAKGQKCASRRSPWCFKLEGVGNTLISAGGQEQQVLLITLCNSHFVPGLRPIFSESLGHIITEMGIDFDLKLLFRFLETIFQFWSLNSVFAPQCPL